MRLLLLTSKSVIGCRWICNSSCGGGSGVRRHASSFSIRRTPEQALRTLGPARTRFAPSPTGYLHLGSLRTALFNYLIAKATGGKFLLRIEDTDQKRTVPDAEERLLEDLEWAGIQWDEGPKVGGSYGPYKQSQRTALYREHAEQLLASGHAYRCFCTQRRLHSLASHRSASGIPLSYDRACARIDKEESDDMAAKGIEHVIRLKIPEKYPVFNDLVYGLVRQRDEFSTNSRIQYSYDDPILIKSDGFPTYHLANVVDDHHMNITHVIRGSEWISSTPKHLALYEAFGWQPPEFAHVGLLVDKAKQKLSKRNMDINISDFRKRHIFPETLINFVALLGWSHTEDSDVLSLKDLIDHASMKFTRGDTVVSFEKLWFLQKAHAARYASQRLSKAPPDPSHDIIELAVKPMVILLDQDQSLSLYQSIPEGQPRLDFVNSVLHIDARNYTTPTDFISRNKYFFIAPTISTLKETLPALQLHNVPPFMIIDTPVASILPGILQFSEIQYSSWTVEEIRSWTNTIIELGTMESIEEEREKQIDADWDGLEVVVRKAWTKLVYQYLRWAISAGKPGPDGAETMKILGKEETVRRLEVAEEIILAGLKQGLQTQET